MSNCTTGCPTQDHASWGECMRSKSLKVAFCRDAAGFDATREKAWQKELNAYADAKAQGLQPETTSMSSIRAAEEAAS